jgi:hypothetical protein
VEFFLNENENFIDTVGFLKTYPEKWRLVFSNVELSILSITFKDFLREMEPFSRIARLFTLYFCDLYKTSCRGGFLVPVHLCLETL